MKELKVTKIAPIPGHIYGLNIFCESGEQFCILDAGDGFASTLDDICISDEMMETGCSEYLIDGTEAMTQKAKMTVAKAVLEFTAKKGNYIIEFEDYNIGDENKLMQKSGCRSGNSANYENSSINSPSVNFRKAADLKHSIYRTNHKSQPVQIPHSDNLLGHFVK